MKSPSHRRFRRLIFVVLLFFAGNFHSSDSHTEGDTTVARNILISYRKLFAVDPMEFLTPRPSFFKAEQNDFLLKSGLIWLNVGWDRPLTKLALMAVAATGSIHFVQNDKLKPGSVTFDVELGGKKLKLKNTDLNKEFVQHLISELTGWVSLLQSEKNEMAESRRQEKELSPELSVRAAYYWLVALAIRFYYPIYDLDKSWQVDWLIEHADLAFRVDDIKNLPPGLKELLLVHIVRTSMQVVKHSRSGLLDEIQRVVTEELVRAEGGDPSGVRTVLDNIRNVLNNARDPQLKRLIGALMKKNKFEQIDGIREILTTGLPLPCANLLENMGELPAKNIGKRHRL